MGLNTFLKSEWSTTTASEGETMTLAERLGHQLKPGDFLSLGGDLGAGKTVFVQGVAKALGCHPLPTSPTFSLVQTHAGRRGGPGLRHVDLYRLTPPEVVALEWEELTDSQGVTAVEWADRAKFLWPTDCLVVLLSHAGQDERTIVFRPTGPRGVELIKKLRGK